jgi:ankyrin repeat protein
VEALLLLGVNPQVADSLGRTLLHHASRRASQDTVALLCGLNVDVDAPDLVVSQQPLARPMAPSAD